VGAGAETREVAARESIAHGRPALVGVEALDRPGQGRRVRAQVFSKSRPDWLIAKLMIPEALFSMISLPERPLLTLMSPRSALRWKLRSTLRSILISGGARQPLFQ
jgi:hypothetical protein